jgi:glutamate--cysteine ligase
MSLDATQTESPPIGSTEELLHVFHSGSRGQGDLLLGLEHEKLIVAADGVSAVPHQGPQSIEALLQRFSANGYTEYREGEGLPIIAMQKKIETVSLEPGGQFEESGSPFATAREAHAENMEHLRLLKGHASALGLSVSTLGYRPFGALNEMPWMHKLRYGTMKKTLGARGTMALDMMLMTATGQVSLDWRDESDCIEKIAVAVRMAPILVALYANSPVKNSQVTGYQSYRSHVWTDVDKARCGYPACMLDGSFSFSAYAEWALDAPLLFLRRRGTYLSPALTFRQYLKEGFEGQRATQSDWIDHLSTLFPEVRLKKVMEIRSADCASGVMTGALAALMRGVLYDQQARREIIQLIPIASPARHRAVHEAAQKHGLESCAGLAREVLQVARAALLRIDALDAPLLEPLEHLAKTGHSLAVAALQTFQTQGARGMFEMSRI